MWATLIANLFGAVKEIFGFQNKKMDLKNTPEMKKGVVLQQEQVQQDKINAVISKKDDDEMRKLLS